MSGEREPIIPRFRPLGEVATWRLVLVVTVGPVMWVVALLVGAWVVEETDAIETGLAITAGSFVLALVVLSLMRAGRRREERRYVDRR